ncbi:MAG: VOC family protein [Peptostreptococcaceae bacterium]
MKAQINLITIWTDNIEIMKKFYNEVLEFKIINDLGDYVEFENTGVRFAICMREVMHTYSKEYEKKALGQAFELAFPCDNAEDVDITYTKLIKNGAISIHEPKNMTWNQRTALFADPDGNIHEIFAELNIKDDVK